MRQHHRHVEDAHLHLAAEQVVDRGRRALVGHVHDLDARLDLQQLARKVRDAAGAGRAVVDLAGIRFRMRDQLGQRVHGQRRIDHDDFRHAHHGRDQREVPAGSNGIFAIAKGPMDAAVELMSASV